MARYRIALGLLALLAAAVFGADLYLLRSTFMPAVAYMMAVLLAAYLMPGPRWVAGIALWTLGLQLLAYWLEQPGLSLLPASYVAGLSVVSLLCVALSDQATRETALRTRFEAVVSNTPAGIAVLRGPDMVFELANPACQAIAPGKPLLGKSVAEAWPELADQVVPLLRRVLATGEPYHVVDRPLRIRRSPGEPLEEVYLTFSYARLPVMGGSDAILVLVMETTQQVLARRRSEELAAQVAASLAQLRAVVDSMTEGLIISDLQGNVLTMNREALRLYGYAGLEEAQRRLPEFRDSFELCYLDGSFMPTEERPLSRILRGEILSGFELQVRNLKTGAVRIWSHSGTPVRNSAGEAILAVLTLRDVTAQKEAEAERERLLEEVQRRSAELDAAISSSADGMLIYSPSGEIVLTNPAAERMLGYSQEAPKLPLARRMELLHIETPEGRPLPPEELPAQKVLRGEVSPSVVAVLHPPQGRALWATLSAAPIRSPGGKLLGAVLTFTDITPIHELQQQRAKHVLGISHGLRTPLTVIQGQGQLLLRMLGRVGADGRMQHGAEAIVASARRASLLLRDLVDLTSLEHSQPLQLNREPIELPSQVLKLKERLSGVFPTERIRVESAADLPAVSADPDRTERILANLLSNAFKYSGPGTEVTISLWRRNGEVVISVADQGEGIPPEQIPHLFDPYHRTEERPESTGLGLYIAKGLVEAMGGRIWVESQPGRGSTFSFSLPAMVDAPPA